MTHCPSNIKQAIQASIPVPLSDAELAESERNLMRLFKILIEINNEHHIVDTPRRPEYPRLI